MKPFQQSKDQRMISSRPISEYNADGSLRRISYSSSFYIEYEYDRNGNKAKISQYEDGLSTIKEWLYNKNSMVKEIKLDGVILVQYDYTDNGYISKVKYPQWDGSDRVIRYIYDTEFIDRVIEMMDDTDGSNPNLMRKYLYSNSGVLSILIDYHFDQEGCCGNLTEQSFSYNSEGRLIHFIYTDKVLDSSGQLSKTILRESYDLTYDDAGNITVDASFVNYGNPITTVKEYEYDGSDRLTKEIVNGKTIAEYTFDSKGNRKTLTTNNSTLYYDYNELNELTRIAADPSFTNLVTTFTYDDRGNQISERDMTASTVTTYEHDLADRLVKVARQEGDGPATTVAAYWYDGEGQRVKKVTGNATTQYYYDGLKLLYTNDDNSHRIEENIMEPSGKIFAARRFTGRHTGSYLFLHRDIRGSVTNVVDGKGTVVTGAGYDAYGRTRKTGDANFSLSFAYTGAVYDEETELYYMNARYYNPRNGLFITKDNEFFDKAISEHPYGYCNQNPINYTDRSGNCPYYDCNRFGQDINLPTCTRCKRKNYAISFVGNRLTKKPYIFDLYKTQKPNLSRLYYFPQSGPLATKWSGEEYGSGHIVDSGCGIVSMSMVLCSLFDGKVTAKHDKADIIMTKDNIILTLARFARKHKQDSCGGTNPGFFSWYVKEFNKHSKTQILYEHYKASAQDYKCVIDKLKQGCIVIKHQKHHYIVLTPIVNWYVINSNYDRNYTKVLVYDPSGNYNRIPDYCYTTWQSLNTVFYKPPVPNVEFYVFSK